MKHRITLGKLQYTVIVLALSTAFAVPACAQDNPDIEALRRQVQLLTEQINKLAAKQDLADQKQQKLDTQLATGLQSPAMVARPDAEKTVRPVTNRYAGMDVRVFGSFDTYIESQQTGAGMVNRLASSGNGYTQLGFDVSRDVGNGFRAFGDVRLSYQTDNGKTNSTLRVFNTATVGLTSNQWGTLQVGRMGTQMGFALASFRLIRLGTGNFIYNPFTTLTHDNTVKYTSPTFAKMQASASIDLGETVDNQKKGRGWSTMLKYDDGKTVALAGIMTSNSPTDIAAANDKMTIQSAGVSHDFGRFKPFVVMQRAKSSLAPLTLNQTGWYTGVDFPVGPGILRLEREWINNKAWTKADARSYNARYDWFLTPETSLYFVYTRILDDENVYYPIVGTGGFAAVPVGPTSTNPSFNTALNGKSPHGIAAGIKLDF